MSVLRIEIKKKWVYLTLTLSIEHITDKDNETLGQTDMILIKFSVTYLKTKHSVDVTDEGRR